MAFNKPKSVTNQCCESAEKILNQSQGQPSYSSHHPGHPRYHVLCNPNFDRFTILSDLPSLGCTEAVTQHLGNTKTAFLSKHDQNSCLHEVLNTPTGKEAMRLLNSNRNEILIRAPVHELSNNNFLRMVEVVHGDRLEEQQASSVVLILGHHVDKADGRYVHVKTFYPTNRHINSSIIETLHGEKYFITSIKFFRFVPIKPNL